MIIRQETIDDYKAVYEVNKRAFNKENESILVKKIRESDGFIPELSLIAEEKGEIVGYILLSKIKIVGIDEHTSLALAPVAVVPEFQSKGIGGELIKEVLKRAKGLGYGSVILLGHKEYYPRFGFKKASNWKIECPFEVDDDYFMAIELQDNSLNNVSGVVKYPDVFMEV